MIKRTLAEMIVILGVMTTGYLLNWDEMVFLFKYDDIGTIISTFGLLWFIATIFGGTLIYKGWEGTLISIGCSFAIAISGYVLHDYGIYYTIMILGICMAIIAFLVTPIYPPLGKCIFILALILGFTGYGLREFSTPTKKPEISTRDIDINATWKIIIRTNEPTGLFGYHDWTFIGTEKRAIKKAKQIRENFAKKNPESPVYSCELSWIDIPEWYHRKHGFPEKKEWLDIK